MLKKISHSFCDEKTIFCKLFLYVLCIPTLRLSFALSTPIFPKKWLRLQKLQFFLSQFLLPSLEGDNNIYILLSIIITYNLKVFRNPYTPPPPLKTVTSVTVTTVTIFAQNQRSLVEVKGAARLLALSSVMCWDIKRADNAVRLHIKSSDAAKRCIARPAKNRYGVCEGKVQY